MKKREKHTCGHTGEGNIDSMIKSIIGIEDITDNIKGLLKKDNLDIEEVDYGMEELECETNILLDSYEIIKHRTEEQNE